MLSENETIRYSRQIQLEDFGIEGQERLKKARVVIVGAGGLGCPLIQYLSASGIGEITIVDGDYVSETNLQRQLIYSLSDIGKHKAELAAKRAREINPYVQVNAECSFLSVELALNLFVNADLIVDCTDNFGTRYLINDVCVLLNKPFVSAALYKYEGQLSIYNVKSIDGYSVNYRDVFPEDEDKNNVLDCNAAGVIATLPGLMGLYQANEVIKYFLDKTFCLTNKLLTVDSKRMTHQIFDLVAKGETKYLSREEIENKKYVLPCNNLEENNDFSVSDLIASINNEEVMLVDVRDLGELPKLTNIKHLNIPLSELEARKQELAIYKRLIFICKSGSRSAQAKSIVKDMYTDVQCEESVVSVEHLMKELRRTIA